MYNLRNQKIDFSFHPQYIKEDVHNGKLKRSRTEVGDLIMNIVGPPLGKLASIPPSLPESNFNQAAVLIRPLLHKDIINRWLFYYLSEMSEINSISTKGSAGQVNISLTQSQNMRVPMPPLAEQVRICSEIEKLWQDLDCIDTSSVVLGDTIECVKSKILDLAIHGKLVPQDPTDESASELLKRINPKAIASCDNPHYTDLPRGWVILKGKDLFKPMKSTKPSGETFKYIDIDSINNKNGVVTAPKILKSSDAPSRATRFTVKGDIVFSMVRPYLRNIAIVPENGCIASTGFYVCSPNGVMSSDYCYYLMTSNYVVEGLNKYMKGDNSPSINNNHINEWLFPVPPLKEQLRIVSKLQDILSPLDSIMSSLQA